jgi:type I restriction enzyme S subunit
MEVRKGYKQADIGILPNDWNATIIDELVEKVGSGITPTGGEKVYTKEGHPFLRSQNVGWGELLLNDVAYISDETHKTFPATEICSGDVFLNITGASIGRSALASSSIVGGNVNQHVCIIRPNETKLRSAFLCFSLLSSIGQNQIESFQAGGNRQGLNFAQIRSIKIPLPPTLAEQTAIAIALSDTDALIQNLEKLIAKKRAIKKGAMQELLTGKKRLPGFSGKWEKKRLGDILENIVGGGTPSRTNPNYWNGNIPWVTVKDFATFTPFAAQENITKEGLNNSASHLIPKGTLITSTRMALGKAVVYSVDVSINQDLKALFPVKDIDRSYLYYWFQFHEKQIADLGSGSTVMGLSLPELKRIPFNKPTPPEQTAIAAIFSDMDIELIALETKLAKYRTIKQGMMQELLTGKTRLV